MTWLRNISPEQWLREPETTLANTMLIDKNKTLDALEKRSGSVSWSEYTSFKGCQSSWFIQNYAATESADQERVQNSLESIPGTIIQRVFEALVNDKVYERPNLISADSLQEWVRTQISNLIDLTLFNLKDQFDPVFQQTFTGHYFTKNRTGSASLRNAIDSGKLDPVFGTNIKPQFIDPDDLNTKYGSVEGLKKTLADVSINALSQFALFAPVHHTISEPWVTAKFHTGDKASGAIDFLTNGKAGPRPNNRLTNLQDGYYIMDGKYRVWKKYTNPDQLQWYLSLLRLSTRREPRDSHGLFDWSKAEYHSVQFDSTFLSRAMSTLDARQQTIAKLKGCIRAKPSSSFSIYDSGLSFSASTDNCKFCLFRTQCQERQSAGISAKDEPKPKLEVDPTKIEILL